MEINSFLDLLWNLIVNMENGERASFATGVNMISSMKSIGKTEFSQQAMDKIKAPIVASIVRLNESKESNNGQPDDRLFPRLAKYD